MGFDYNIDTEIALLEKYELNPTELFVVKTLLLTQEGYSEDYLIRYLAIPESARGDLREVLTSLQNKGIILKSYKIPQKGKEFDPMEIPIAQNFFNTIYRNSFDMGKELLDTYPMFGQIQGSVVSLRGVSKKFDSLEDFFRFYGKQIKWNPEKHKEILELINWEQNNNIGFINFSLATFVIEHKWNELKALKEGKLVNTNYDTLTSL